MKAAVVVVICALSLLPVARAAGEEDPELEPYVVVAGDTCMALVRERLGPSGNLALLHRFNPQLGPTPHHLKAGQILMLPRRGPRAPVAQIAAMQPDVQSRSPEAADWQEAQVGQDLYRAWRVNTRDRATATLRFGDATRLFMREQTLVIIYGGSSDLVRKLPTEATLERGTLRSRLDELAGVPLQVTTPSADATLGGGSAVVAVDPVGRSAVSNHAGAEALVKGRRGPPVRVARTMGTTVATGAPPARPRALPPAPSWIAGAPGLVAGAPGFGGTIRGAWSAVAAAARYHVEVQDVAGNRVLVSVDVPATITQVAVHGVPDGPWRVTVAAIDADSLESVPSDPLAVDVSAMTILPPGAAPLQLPPAADRTTEPAPPRLLVGTRLRLPAGMRCAIGGDTPSPEVTLRSPGLVTPRCLADGGVVGAFPVDVVAVRAEAPYGARVVRGERATIVLRVESELELPVELGVVGSRGVTVDQASWRPDHTVALVVAAGAAAASASRLEITAGDGAGRVTLTSVPLTVETPGSPALVAPPGIPSSPSLLSMRAVERTGAVIWFAAGVRELTDDPDDTDDEASGRVALGAAFRRGDVSLRAAGSFGFGVPEPDAAFAAGIGYATLRSRSAGLDLELGTWIPLTDGAADVALVPSLDAWVRPFSPVALRSRQGAVLGGDRRLWSSAYGLDVSILRWLSAGLELDVGFGEAHDVRTRAAALALLAGVESGRYLVSVSVRLAANDDARRLWDASALSLVAGLRF